MAAAKSAFGPRVKALASWEADDTTLVGNDGNNWLAGVELEFDLFQGGAKAARLGRERAIEERLDAVRHAAEDAVRLEVLRAYYDLDAARQQMDVARSALAQAQEACASTRTVTTPASPPSATCSGSRTPHVARERITGRPSIRWKPAWLTWSLRPGP